jgi:hypothetical protein
LIENGLLNRQFVSMQSVFTGPVYVVRDNIDTDQIISAQYLNLVPTIPEEYEKLGSFALAGLPESLKPRIDDAASRAGLSANAWLVRVVSAALDPANRAGRGASAAAPPPAGPRTTHTRRFTGWES